MLAEGQPEVVIAFPSTGPGTPGMIRLAKRAGVTVWEPDAPELQLQLAV
jgi:hypothetical protein